MVQIGTDELPLRVAIIGSGPSGFYAAEYLQKQPGLNVQIDMFDRLPTPYGLVRGGVAPDHQKIKAVTNVYKRIASHPEFRFYGNVEFGTDISHDDVVSRYHAVIYAVGAQSDRKLGIPGEDLAGSHSATEFVAWYNAHPDFKDYEFDLSQEAVAVIGVGNVAMDVARILARTEEELMETDIADYALAALVNSNVKAIYVIGRRGPAQAAFTNMEIKELGNMEGADCMVRSEDLQLDPASRLYLESGEDIIAVRNVDYLREYAGRGATGKPKQLHLRFLESPIELLGDDRVEAIRIVRNELYLTDDGSIRPRATDQTEVLPVGLVFRSVGYRGTPLEGVPFYDRWGIIPNNKGRVLAEFGGEDVVSGEYVVGWIKRGPSGVIGTNKPDSIETAKMLLDDLSAGSLLTPHDAGRDSLEVLLHDRGVRFVTFEDWTLIDQLELNRGEAAGRPRLKFADVGQMLSALDEAKAVRDGVA